MTVEEQLIQKRFYESLIKANEKPPIESLGEIFIEEQKKDVPNLTDIRYAQGEVYFQNCDYEAAIFKWENINGELRPWAQKNMADAYFELELYETAESIYQSIETENPVLTMEVYLQLFSLYTVDSKPDIATTIIKEAVDFEPDYPHVTKIACDFFENQQDWSSAVELAVHESIRTKSLVWFDILKDYVEQGKTQSIVPNDFNPILKALYQLDSVRFEKMAEALWKNYKFTDSYFEWLGAITALIKELEITQEDSWKGLSHQYGEAFTHLLEGKYGIKDLKSIIPSLLENWLRISRGEQAIYAAAAIASWNEVFPEMMNILVIQDAENILRDSSKAKGGLGACKDLFISLVGWAEDHDVPVSYQLKWLVTQLVDTQSFFLALVGSRQSGKKPFLESITGESIVEDHATAMTYYQDATELSVYEITSTEKINVPDLDETDLSSSKLIEVQKPSEYLRRQELHLLDMPDIHNEGLSPEYGQYLLSSDGLLFALDNKLPFMGMERDLLLEIKRIAPDLPIHFLYDEKEMSTSNQIEEEIWETIKAYFPNAKLFILKTNDDLHQQMSDFEIFLTNHYRGTDWKDNRTEKILTLIRQTLSYILEKRSSNERRWEHSIEWNEQMEIKLMGAMNQLNDLEKDKIQIITRSYQQHKEEIKKELFEQLPKLLQGCSSFLSETSDYTRIHVQLNDEMNNKIQDYVKNTVMPNYYHSLNKWIEESEVEFAKVQQFMNDMSSGFNHMYQEERISLQGDFRVLEDWLRDADRMTSSIRIEPVNILLRRTPSQLLLKGTGKLLSGISQNKTTISNRYKKFLENEDFLDVVTIISNRFMAQFELFEQALERDISLFFRNSFFILQKMIDELQEQTKEYQETLMKMKESLKTYQEAMMLFQVKLQQLEKLEKVKKKRLLEVQRGRQ